MDKANEIEHLNMIISRCTQCELCETRKNAVSGEGNLNAKIMIVGEGPGEQNDLFGRPFIGRGGKILDSCLFEAQINRKELYLTNIIKCRMPHNAVPSASIVRTCSGFLTKQINIVNPTVIVALGLSATRSFLAGTNKNIKLSDLHGKVLNYHARRLICTYHPSSIRYNPSARENIIEALKLADSLE